MHGEKIIFLVFSFIQKKVRYRANNFFWNISRLSMSLKMLKRRLIPVLFWKDGWIVRSENFVRHQVIGDPFVHVERMTQWDVDELIVVNISREKNGQFTNIRDDYKNAGTRDLPDFVKFISKECFMPLAFGGGIASVSDARRVLLNGAEKIVLGQILHKNEKVLIETANEFGAQAIVACVDYLIEDNVVHIMTDFGVAKTHTDFYVYLKKLEDNGVGEIMLNSVWKDGTANGFDIDVIEQACNRCNVPVIGCGGAGHQKTFSRHFSKN